MRFQRLNADVTVLPMLSIVVLFLSCLTFLPSPSVAAAEDSQAIQEVELYQNDSGEWKVRYANAEAGETATVPSQEPVIATAMAEQAPTEVELYQDDSGAWKVRYGAEGDTQADLKEQSAVPEVTKVPQTEAVEAKKEETVAIPAAGEKEEVKAPIESAKTQVGNPVGEKSVAAAVEEVKAATAQIVAEAKADKEEMSRAIEKEVRDVRTIPMDTTELSTSKTSASNPQPNKVTVSKPVAKVKSVAKVQPVEPVNPYIWSSDDEKSVQAEEISAGKISGRSQDSSASYKEPISGHDPYNNWELGAEVLSYEYKQDIFTNNLDFNQGKDNEGSLYGLHLAYEHVFAQNPPNQSLKDLVTNFDNVNRYKFSADYRIGVAKYREKGDLSADVPADDFTQQSLEVRGVGGFDFMIANKTRLTPFMGLGYRFMHDPSGGIIDIPQFGLISDDGTTFSSIFYDPATGNLDNVMGFSTSTHSFYLPIGLMTNSDITDKLSLGLNAEFDYVFIGVQRSSFSDLGPLYKEDGGDRTVSLKNFSNKLRGGLGFKGSVRLTMKQNKFDWYVEPYARYWHLRKTDKQYELIDSDGTTSILYHDVTTLTDPYKHIEPDNTTTEYGVQVGVVF